MLPNGVISQRKRNLQKRSGGHWSLFVTCRVLSNRGAENGKEPRREVEGGEETPFVFIQ